MADKLRVGVIGTGFGTTVQIPAFRAHPRVEAVFTKEEIGRTGVPSGSPAGWSLIQRVRASFDPERSGDLYVVLKPHIQPISDTSRYVATHGSPWDYDRRVPMLFWRRGMSAAPSDSAVDTVDIMPTIAAMIGLALAPGSVDGRCLVTVAACPSAEPGGGQRGRR